MNPYPPRFLDLLRDTDGQVLDCGSGGRTHRRIVSLEIESHPNNTVQADALALPFAADVFDLILSQAVLEHVTEPQTYVDELVRVLRPGGLVWIEAAFLQPVHQAPRHFFNVTPFGLAYLCRGLEIVEQGVVGGFVESLAWICREAGTRLPPMDEPHRTAEQAWNTGSGVYLLGRKP
ncbi:MAG: SAM-dependent methyltransferase [Acidimicrobiia bacterium]|nr:MAG: SAM-dependent methyltransferase [Acidimicrobiia bacterium]